MEYDKHNNVLIGDSKVFPTAGASSVSEIIDTQGYESLEWLIIMGIITTGTFSTKLEQADDLAFTVNVEDVPTDNVLGPLPTFIATDDNQHRRVGSIGKRRFQRCTILGAATPVAVLALIALQGDFQTAPTRLQATTS